MTTETSPSFAQASVGTGQQHVNDEANAVHHPPNTHCQVANPNSAHSDSINNMHHHDSPNGLELTIGVYTSNFTDAGSNQRRQNSDGRLPSSSPYSQATSQPSTSPAPQEDSAVMATFTPCSNSHPFEERRIPCGEDHLVKIGRAVVRCQPALNNAIFDCKVLSRNHAVMWYTGEKFFIKDTRSSNGTFVNNERLSNSGEDSDPWPLYSGDILQLGVEIVDNAKKVASGCVTCIVTLKNERGEECHRPSSENCTAAATTLAANGGAASSFSENISAHNNTNNVVSIERMLMENGQFAMKYTLVPNNKMFIMNQYMKEARFRENALGAKLQALEEQLAAAQEALENSWQALINEEHLLSRIEILESQLALYAATSKSSGNSSAKSKGKIAAKNEAQSNGKEHLTVENGTIDMLETKKDAAIEADKIVCDEGTTSVKATKPAHDEIIREEIQEIYEDRAKAELAAKDALRKAEEEVFESTMRLHDVETSLLNVESENALLRRQCDDYEAELSRQRATLDETLADVGKLREDKLKQDDNMTKLTRELNRLREEITNKTTENEAMFIRLAKMAFENVDKQESDKDDRNYQRNKEDLNNLNLSGEQLAEIDVNEEAKENVSDTSANTDAFDVKSETSKTEKQIDFAENKKESDFDGIDSADDSHSHSELVTSFLVPAKNRCACGRVLINCNTDPYAERPSRPVARLSSSASIQIFLFSTLPLIVLLVALMLPLAYFWPSGNSCVSTPLVNTDTVVDDASLAAVVRNGTATPSGPPDV